MLEILSAAEFKNTTLKKAPTISIGLKTGYFFFNEPAAEIMSINAGDKINFGFDKAKNAWFIIKETRQDHQGFELKKYGKRKNNIPTKSLKVTCSKIAGRIASSFAIKKKEGSAHFSIDPEPVAQEGFITYRFNLLK